MRRILPRPLRNGSRRCRKGVRDRLYEPDIAGSRTPCGLRADQCVRPISRAHRPDGQTGRGGSMNGVACSTQGAEIEKARSPKARPLPTQRTRSRSFTPDQGSGRVRFDGSVCARLCRQNAGICRGRGQLRERNILPGRRQHAAIKAGCARTRPGPRLMRENRSYISYAS